MVCALSLSPILHAQIEREARAALPRECCGLIEGVREGSVVQAAALHPTHNLATEPDRFEIDPAAHISLMRSLRGTERKIVGCYHSHPDGSGELSERDRACDCEDGFVWLIAALGNGAGELRAYIREHADFHTLDLDDDVRSARSG